MDRFGTVVESNAQLALQASLRGKSGETVGIFPRPIATIELRSPSADPQVYPVLRSRVTVGRYPECNLVTPITAASKHHLTLHFLPKAKMIMVEDCDSANGTYLVGEASTTPVGSGDRLEPHVRYQLPAAGRLDIGTRGALEVHVREIDWSAADSPPPIPALVPTHPFDPTVMEDDETPPPPVVSARQSRLAGSGSAMLGVAASPSSMTTVRASPSASAASPIAPTVESGGDEMRPNDSTPSFRGAMVSASPVAAQGKDDPGADLDNLLDLGDTPRAPPAAVVEATPVARVSSGGQRDDEGFALPAPSPQAAHAPAADQGATLQVDASTFGVGKPVAEPLAATVLLGGDPALADTVLTEDNIPAPESTASPADEGEKAAPPQPADYDATIQYDIVNDDVALSPKTSVNLKPAAQVESASPAPGPVAPAEAGEGRAASSLSPTQSARKPTGSSTLTIGGLSPVISVPPAPPQQSASTDEQLPASLAMKTSVGLTDVDVQRPGSSSAAPPSPVKATLSSSSPMRRPKPVEESSSPDHATVEDEPAPQRMRKAPTPASPAAAPKRARESSEEERPVKKEVAKKAGEELPTRAPRKEASTSVPADATAAGGATPAAKRAPPAVAATEAPSPAAAADAPPAAAPTAAAATHEWQFKSDLRKVDTNNAAWTSYPSADSQRIEVGYAAFKDAKKPTKKITEFKFDATYGLHFKDMVQFRWEDRDRQRGIRRVPIGAASPAKTPAKRPAPKGKKGSKK